MMSKAKYISINTKVQTIIRDRERQRETEKDIERQRKTQKDRERQRDIENDREPQGQRETKKTEKQR